MNKSITQIQTQLSSLTEWTAFLHLVYGGDKS